jgi:predicted glycosyl hydrolase (DUF1957 family)
MEIGFFILGIIALLGTFSLYQNGKKKTLIAQVVQNFLDNNGGTLIEIKKPMTSGPFKDEYFNQQGANLYQNVGYQKNETVYREISYKTADKTAETAWLQLRIESLKATYSEWK